MLLKGSSNSFITWSITGSYGLRAQNGLPFIFCSRASLPALPTLHIPPSAITSASLPRCAHHPSGPLCRVRLLVAFSLPCEVRGRERKRMDRMLEILTTSQTLYIFFGVAALVGIVTGTGLHYASGFMASVLNIDSRAEERQVRSVAEYRAKRQEKRKKEARSPVLPEIGLSQPKPGGAMREEYSEWLKQNKGVRRKKGVIPSTILEEDDSSEDGFSL